MTLISRYPWLPKDVLRAFRNDARLGIVQFGQLEAAYVRYQRLSDTHPSPSLRGKYERITKTIINTLVPRLRNIRQVRQNYQKYREESRILNQRLKQWRNSVESPGKLSVPGESNPKAALVEDLDEQIKMLGAIRINTAKLARRVYPNSMKKAPHAGWCTWNGTRHISPDKLPWTAYWAELFGIDKLWNLKPFKYRDESSDSYQDRKELYQIWYGDNKAPKWLTSKYMDEIDLIYTKSFNVIPVLKVRPKKPLKSLLDDYSESPLGCPEDAVGSPEDTLDNFKADTPKLTRETFVPPDRPLTPEEADLFF